jgi:branched-chain amino acid transport system substrate-binding protein
MEMKTSFGRPGRILPSILLGAMLLAAVGCGQTTNNETIKIGAVFSLTGSGALFGSETAAGAKMAVDEINKAGGVDGKKLELTVEDSQTSAQQGVTAYQSMVSLNHPVVVLGNLSSVSMALSPLASENKIPFLSSGAYAKDLTKQNDWTFRYFPLAEDSVEPMKKTVQQLGIHKLGVIYTNEDYGRSVYAAWQKVEGLEVNGEAMEISATDLRDQLTKLQDKGVEAIYIAGYEGNLLAALQQYVELNLHAIFMTNLTAAYPQVTAKIAGYDFPIYADNIKFSNNDFVQKCKDLTGMSSDANLAAGYDSIYLIVQVMKEYGYSPENIKNGLAQIKAYQGVLGDVIVDGRDFRFKSYPVVIQNGTVSYL